MSTEPLSRFILAVLSSLATPTETYTPQCPHDVNTEADGDTISLNGGGTINPNDDIAVNLLEDLGYVHPSMIQIRSAIDTSRASNDVYLDCVDSR